MGNINRTYKLDLEDPAPSDELETEVSNVVNAWNNHDLGILQWTNLWAQLFRTQLIVVTSGASYAPLSSDTIIVVNKSVGSATTINLPASPSVGRWLVIKDGKGDAATNNITITPNAGNIDGNSTFVLTQNNLGVIIVYDGTQWEILSRSVSILPSTLNNNRILISSGGAIVEQSAQTAGRLLLADGSGLPVSTGAGALNGNLSFVATSTQGVLGSTTNDSAATGNVGESVRAAATGVSISSSATYINVASISLTAGDWDVSGCANLITTGVTTSGIAALAISKNSGNTITDHVSGDNQITFGTPLFSDVGTAIPSYRVSIASSATYYLKVSSTFTVGTPTADGRISARRAR